MLQSRLSTLICANHFYADTCAFKVSKITILSG